VDPVYPPEVRFAKNDSRVSKSVIFGVAHIVG